MKVFCVIHNVYLDEKYPYFEVYPEPDNTLCPGLKKTILKKWDPHYFKGPTITAKDKSKIKCPMKKHIVSEYQFRNIKTTPTPWRYFVATEYSLNFGIRLMACNYNPTTHYQDDDAGVFHLLFLFRDELEFTGKSNPFWALKKFLKHLETQPQSKIKAVILRPVSPLDSPSEYDDLKILNFKKSKYATTEKLKQIYSKVLGAYESRMEDGLGGRYWTVPFKPQNPAIIKDFEWPKLLQKA